MFSESFAALRNSSLALGLLLSACAGAPYPEGHKAELFPLPPRPVDQAYNLDGHRVHYLEMPGGPARVLFVHGSPGDWKAWAAFLADPRLRARATLIAADRPGFGSSDPGRIVPALAEQSRLLQPLLQGPGAPTVLVGHSLGGPVVGRMAMDYPAQVRAVLLIAPAIDPATEQPRWYNRLMRWSLSEWLMPERLAWSNREIMPLAGEVAALAPRWRALPMPLTLMQGEQDTDVDPRTADFAAAVFPPDARIVRLPDQDHFVLWQQPQLIVDAILDLLDRSAAASGAGA